MISLFAFINFQTYIKNQSEVGFLRSEISSFLNSRIFSARHCLLLAFRSIVANCFVNPAMEEGHNVGLSVLHWFGLFPSSCPCGTNEPLAPIHLRGEQLVYNSSYGLS